MRTSSNARHASTLIVPVENQVREFDAKLLLSCVAAERGLPVIIGSRPYVNFAMPWLPRGVFLAKSLRSISKLMLGFIRNLGHHIVAWDEESLVRFASDEYYAWRYSADTFRVIDRMFAWGPDDARYFAAYSGYRGAPIHITGNPRIDLLRPEVRGYFDPEAAAIRARFGDFILINTNFSFVNAFVPGLNLMQPGASAGAFVVGRAGRGLSHSFAAGMAAHQQVIYDRFRELIPLLGQWFPDQTIVLRPHPSENPSTWRDVTAGNRKVHVLHEGNVVPWLMAARLLLHNGCTTAVEAAVLGTPSISYQPVRSECYDYHLPNSQSHQAASPEEVRERIAAILAGRLGRVDSEHGRAVLARHLTATCGPLAVDRVMDVLQAEGYFDAPPPRPPLPAYAKAWLGTHARTAIKHFNMLRPGHRNSAAYHAHRFPDISVDEINARVARFSRQLGRFGELRVHALSRYLFSVAGPACDLRAVARPGDRRIVTVARGAAPGRAVRSRAHREMATHATELLRGSGR